MNKNKKSKGKTKSAPVAKVTKMVNSNPETKESRDGRRIRNREFIGNVTIDTTFAAFKYAINPGILATFPWLSTQATGWEQYHFYKLKFTYVTRSPTSVIGSVIMAMDYDPLDTPPLSEAAVTAYKGAVESSCWTDLELSANQWDMYATGPRKFVRDGSIAGSLKNYDSGNLFVCTTGGAAASTIGKLWVEYDIGLFVPQKDTNIMSAVTTHFTRETSQAIADSTWDVVELYLGEDPLGLGPVTAGEFVPPKGCYVFNIDVTAADSINEAFDVTIDLGKNTVLTGQVAKHNNLSGPCTINLGVNGIIACNGTDTIGVYIYPVGVAGNLSIQKAHMLFRVA